MEVKKKGLKQLFVPIYFEVLFLMLAGMVDTLMLSSVGDNAVGAVGTANTYISMFVIMFSVISSGMVAVMTQNIGAKRIGIAYQARQLGLIFSAVMGILLSLVLFFGSEQILDIVGVSNALKEPAQTYLQIVGGACILNALIPIFSSYLRAFGYTKESLVASIISNVINLIFNAIFLYVFKYGVAGVAWATVISRLVNLVIVILISNKLIKAKNHKERTSNKLIIEQIIKVGFPSALESAIYNFCMTLVFRFLNQMDDEGLNVTARSYAAQISNFSFCAGAALAQANAILTGWRIGAKEFDECDKGTKRAAFIGVIVAIILEAIFAIFGKWIVGFFTSDADMINLVVKLLAIDILLECGRVTNLVYGQALKTSGDAICPVVLAVIFMFLCSVGGTYVFGIKFKMLAVGAYIGLTADEICRAIGMALRWRSGKWRNKGFVLKE